MVLHLLWAIFVAPETNGKSLEELTRLMTYGRHCQEMEKAD